MNLDQLEELAKNVGGQKFTLEGFEQKAGAGNFYGGLIMDADGEIIVAQCVMAPWANFIEAANPAAVLELIALIRQQEAELKAERASTATLTESMRTLALAIWRDNYKADSPQFEVLPDAAGILSQIDNMVCGMARAALPATGAMPGWVLVPIEPTHEMLDEGGRMIQEQIAASTAMEFQADAHNAWCGMLRAAPSAQPAPTDAGQAQALAVVYPEDGTVSPFTVINLGTGKVKIGDSIHDARLPALWFGKDGTGMGDEEVMNRAARNGETLAVVTFSNVEGLDVLAEVVARIRRDKFPDAAPAVQAQPVAPTLKELTPEEIQAIENQFNWHNARACGTHVRFARAMIAAMNAHTAQPAPAAQPEAKAAPEPTQSDTALINSFMLPADAGHLALVKAARAAQPEQQPVAIPDELTNTDIRSILHCYSRMVQPGYYSDTEFDCLQDVIGFARAIIARHAAPVPAAAPEPLQGWKMVPVEPTDEMLGNVDEKVGGSCYSCSEWNASWDDCRRVYAAMLAAAPVGGA